jgi:2-methylcitrate dehydratase PrpD
MEKHTQKATEKMVKFVLETKEGDVPPEIFHEVKRACLDGIGCMLLGSTTPHGRIITKFVKDNGGNPQATIVGTGMRTSATNAALANGYYCHTLDYDDSGGYGHCTTSLLPALLATGEMANASGKDILMAYIAGWEFAAALCRGGEYDQMESGWHGTGLYGSLASAAGAGRLLGLNYDQLLMALGVTCSETSGLERNNGTMTKPFHPAMACRNGVMAALLAKDGFTSYDNIFEARTGFCDTYIGVGRINMDRVADGIGKPFTFLNLHSMKKYPCCGGNHSALDALFCLLKGVDKIAWETLSKPSVIKYDDIVRVDGYNFSNSAPVVRFKYPRTEHEAKFCVQYVLGVAILEGKVTVDSFTNEKVANPKYREAWEKVHINIRSRYERPETEAKPVTLTLKDGRLLSKKVDHILGRAHNPLPQEALIDKFKQNAAHAISAANANKAADLWMNLEKVGNIAEALRPVAGG